jgi:hypothetical protein
MAVAKGDKAKLQIKFDFLFAWWQLRSIETGAFK